MKKLLFIPIIVFGFVIHAQSQQLVKGIVTVEGGNPVSEVEVIVKNTGQKVVTDKNGEFSIVLSQEHNVLIFKKKGFLTHEVIVKSNILYVQIGFDESGIFDMSLEDIIKLKVEVASPKARPVIEMPSIITLITKEEIENSGARDLLDLLRYVPGLDFAAELDHVIGIGIRGNNSTEGKVLVLIDGQQMNETNFGSFNFGQHVLLDNIERIEILRGPGSAIYGGVAELAVINIITKNGSAYDGIHASVQSSFSNGDILTHGFQLEGGKGFKNDLEFSLSAYGYQGSKSNFKEPAYAGNFINYADSSSFTSYNINFGASYKSLMIRYIHDHKTHSNLEKQIGEVLFEGNYLGISYKWKASDDLTIIPNLKWKNQKPWQFHDYPAYEIYNSINNRYRSNLTAVYDIAEKINLVFGAEYFVDQGRKETESVVYSSNNKTEITYSTSAAFFEANLFPNIANITIGARFDFHSQYGSAFVPRFALTKVMNKFHTKLMLTSAFKAPTIQNVDINPEIKPETSNIIELELGYQFTKNMLANINFFNIDISNAIVYEWMNNADHYTNYEKTGTKGFELEYKIKGDGLLLNLGYSFYMANNNNEVPDYEIEEHDHIYGAYSNHKVSFISHYRLFDNLLIAPSFLFYSKRYTYIYDDQQNLMLHKFEPVFLANLFIEYRNLFTDGLSMSIGTYDITNQKYAFLNAFKAGVEPIYQPGRELRFKVGYAF